jgi:hypothetical protein
MIKKTLVLIIGVILVFGTQSYAQTQSGELRGKITDGEKGDPLPFVNVVLMVGGTQKGGASSDMDGNYIIKPINPGTYDIHVSSVGYNNLIIKDFEIGGNKISFQNIKLTPSILNMTETVIQGYAKPLVEQDEGSGGRLSKEEIKKAPTRSVADLVNLTAGMMGGSSKGQRTTGTVYFVDGVRVRGNLGVPQSSIQEINTITGGIPAEYGDLVGGVVSITTKGPSAKFAGGIEGISSQFLDAFGYNVIEGNVSGPLLLKNKKAKGTDSAEARLGFLLSANANYNKDPYPTATGVWKLKDERYDYLYNNPISLAPSGTGVVTTAEFMTKDDMELVKANSDINQSSYNVTGKLNLMASKNLNVVLGGNMYHGDTKGYNYAHSLFNYKETAKSIGDYNTYRTYLTITQHLNFGGDQKANDKKKIKISNAYYTLSLDYTKQNQKNQHSVHGDNIFDYGYLGKFEEYYYPVYTYGQDTLKGKLERANLLLGYADSLITFTPSTTNQSLANYTSQLYELNNGIIRNWPSITQTMGLRNGDAPGNVYSLWANIGSPTTGYSYAVVDQLAVRAQASADLNKHAIKIGFEYQQQIQRSYGVDASRLWTVMRQLMNSHIQQLNTSDPQGVYSSDSVFLDTINYPRLNDRQQTTFDKNFRNYLMSIGDKDVYGKPIDTNSNINIDRYSPDQYSLSMFSPDELLENSLVSYVGYDRFGKKLTKKPSYEDFLNDKDENGVYTRLIAPINPIYIAGYIQDQFVYKDIIFRLGLRVDRFDANQPVLKDKYSLYPTRSVVDVKTIGKGKTPVTHPSIMGQDYVVYVDDPFNPTKIVGYRNGDQWYDATGAEIVDPNILALQTTSGRIAPYLTKENEDELEITKESFKDYEPQLNFSPRIYFSFPLSDDANFYANYDVRTQRPDANIYTTIDDYYFLEQRGTASLNNAALKPQRITSYEVGFKQALSKNTALSLNAYYNETRFQINQRMINQAYPRSYQTWDNIDFSTTKGLSLTYDLRKTKTSNVSVVVSYTLQFAEGTGSNSGSQAGLIAAGQPNLRTPFPLDNDNRHNFTASIDYRFKGGQAYNGPTTNNGYKILQNTGANLMLVATSGRPYSKQSNVTEAVGIGIRQSEVLKGTINGSRFPWSYNLNLRVDRDFFISYKKVKDKKKIDYSKGMYLNVYIWISNLLDTRGVAGVYRYTGDPNDDGFLSSSYGLTAIESATNQLAFYDQYSIKVNSPYNYVAPRIIRLGVILNF